MNAFHPVSRLSLTWLTGLIVTGGCALLVACGGGGGGGGDDRIAITSTNAEQVASETATVPMGIASLAGLSDQVLAKSIRSPTDTSVAAYLLAQTRRIAGMVAGSRDPLDVTAAAMETKTIPCASGRMVVTANDADDSHTLSSGDRASVALEDCQDEMLGGRVSGALTIDIEEVTGDFETSTPPYSLRVMARFVDFVIADTIDGQEETFAISADMTLTTGTQDGVRFTASISGESLGAEESGPDADNKTLRNYAFNLVRNDNTGESSIDGHGDIVTSALRGSVHFDITTPYVELDTESNPHAGVMTVTGANNSQLTITVLDTTQVRLDTDEDGDGTTDATATVLWQTLDE